MGDGEVIVDDMTKRKKDKVCIIGFADSKTQAPYDDPDYEFWGVNEMWADKTIKKCDVLFELHDYKWICEGKRLKEHIKWLRENKDVPVFMQRHFDDIPLSIPFPKDDLIQKYGSYFTNTISWEIALAMHLGFREIRLYGVNMSNDIEYSSQRPSCEYYIGLARGMGITVYIPPESDLLKSMYLYGFEDGELSIISAKMDAFIKEQDARMAGGQNTINQAAATVNQAIGAKHTAEYFKKAFIYPNTNHVAEKLKER
ncbi:MAG: hypothetical protein UY40_C0017G0001 [candidate division CPR1 bacterium GW2011_GWC1_49_13]|uniref:Uncharacterized protein n=1 Tax=candidate division CPR1 bacterium GW2011_GWC1_49_13 TaxID=1618342 RepID=A0A0G1VG24_9BACT|nr:MAG: hypothetical protein UY40_C0017G0001 [candidate division CPR1 bacterium GW2011_GWC1_49_13]